MIREGDMVRAGGGPIVRVVQIFNGMARCVHIDQHGRLNCQWRYCRDLSPWWASVGNPRSLWPETTDAPDINWGVAKKRQKSTKPKISKKIKRRQTPDLTTARFDLMFGAAA